MKAYTEVEIQRQTFLTSALAGVELPASCSGRTDLAEKSAGTHWMGERVVQSAGVVALMNLGSAYTHTQIYDFSFLEVKEW